MTFDKATKHALLTALNEMNHSPQNETDHRKYSRIPYEYDYTHFVVFIFSIPRNKFCGLFVSWSN